MVKTTLSRLDYSDLLVMQNSMAKFALTALLARKILNAIDYKLETLNEETLNGFINTSSFTNSIKGYLSGNLRRYLYEMSRERVLH